MYNTVNTTTMVVIFCIFVYDILIQLKDLGQPMSEKEGKESQYSLAPPSRSALMGRGKGLDKLVSEPRFRRLWKSLRLRITYIIMCWPNADVLILCIV